MPPESPNKIEVNLDATALGSSACILNLIRRTIGDPDYPAEGAYAERLMPASMVYGIAGHEFIKTMYLSKGNLKQALLAAIEIFHKIPTEDPPKTKQWLRDDKHLQAVCYNIWTLFFQEDGAGSVVELEDGKPGIERNFIIPHYYEDDYLVVNLVGTLDALYKFLGGIFAIRDMKFTSAWDNDGYFEQYELSRQLRLYAIALKWMAQKFPDSVLGQIGATKFGAFIVAIFLKSKPNEVEVRKSDIFLYSDHDLNQFQLTLDDKIRQLSQALKTGYYPKEGILNGSCMNQMYGKKCWMWHVCKSNDQVANILLSRDFLRKKHDPLNYNK